MTAPRLGAILALLGVVACLVIVAEAEAARVITRDRPMLRAADAREAVTQKLDQRGHDYEVHRCHRIGRWQIECRVVELNIYWPEAEAVIERLAGPVEVALYGWQVRLYSPLFAF